uniref:Uncharacterized protein n=1 Tax=Romanomermis culicivorax TaxID=13658 RepID=A0A915KWD1_ROMCU
MSFATLVGVWKRELFKTYESSLAKIENEIETKDEHVLSMPSLFKPGDATTVVIASCARIWSQRFLHISCKNMLHKVRLIHINYFELNSAIRYSRPDGNQVHKIAKKVPQADLGGSGYPSHPYKIQGFFTSALFQKSGECDERLSNYRNRRQSPTIL